MRRDVGNELIVAIAAVAVLALAVIFGIILTLSNTGGGTVLSPTSTIVVAEAPTSEDAGAGEEASAQPTTPPTVPPTLRPTRAESTATDVPSTEPPTVRPTDISPTAVAADSLTPTGDITETIVALSLVATDMARERNATQTSTGATAAAQADTQIAAVGTTPAPVETDRPTRTPTDEPTAIATDTPTVTPTDTPQPTNTKVPPSTPTPTQTHTRRPTNTPAPTAAPTDTDTPQPTDTPSPTDTPRPTSTRRPSNTATPSPTNTTRPTNTRTPLPTDTPEPTATPEPSDTPTHTASPSHTATDRPTNTATVTRSSTPTRTPTATREPSNTPTRTAHPTTSALPTAIVLGGAAALPTPLLLGGEVSLTDCTFPEGWATYFVQEGDTLYRIAQAVFRSVGELRDTNCLRDVDSIYMGMTLHVPFVPAIVPPAPPAETATPEALPPAQGCTDLRAQIALPEAGDQVSEIFTVFGTALVEDFQYYQLEIRPDGSDLYSFYDQVETAVVSGALAQVNTGYFDDGLHWLRLMVVDSAGGAPETCAIPLMFP